MKNIIDKIKKIAQSIGDDIPAAPKRHRPVAQAPKVDNKIDNAVPSKHTNTPSPGTALISTSVPAVKEMQKAILNFANVASSTDVTSLSGTHSERQYGDQSRLAPNDMPVSKDLGAPEDNKKEYLGGSDPFGNFLVQQYVKNDPVGHQYLNVDVGGNANREKSSIEDISLRGIIDSIKRIGSPGTLGTEKSVDGIWQVRTNNALKNIYALTNAMLNFVRDMKMNVPGFDFEQLKEFQSKIPNSYTDMKSQQDITQRATEIIPRLTAITNFFNSLKKTVFNNQELRKYIDQKEPFAKYETSTAVPDAMKFQGIPGISFEFVQDPKQNWISLNELSSPDEFKKFVNRTVGPMAGDNPENVKKVLDMVAKKINLQRDPGY